MKFVNPVTHLSPSQSQRAVALWLLVCCALIFSMVVLGGVTRLTRSGLSMVEWDPIMGMVPPLTKSQWQEAFTKYKQFPEYQKINQGINLEEFKSIFWFEYAHRLLGRTIGLAFILPFLIFLIMKKISRELIPKLVVMFILGGLQGLLGWYMVKSGLVNKPHVSQYRLTAHLIAAIAIYGYIFWVALGLLLPWAEKDNPPRLSLKRFGLGVTALIFIMIASGGFVAGTKAGFAFNTFPLMDGSWIPEGLFALEPWFINFFENVAAIQFYHRLIAWLLFFIIPVYWFLGIGDVSIIRIRRGFHVLLAMLAIQLALGITTLLYVVPVPLAAAHQMGALMLFTMALYLNHALWVSRTTP